LPLLSAAILLSACGQEEAATVSQSSDYRDVIYTEIRHIADEFLAHRPMPGFAHDMPLSEAYAWQDRLVEYMQPDLGPVVGWKTGGHNPGPGFATFPPDGIRGAILQGMVFPSGTAVTLDQTRRGFLEADFAFRVGDDSINTAMTDLETLAALDAIIPFAEIPDPYYEEGTRSINGTIVANMGSRMSFVGEPLLLAPTEEWIARINNFTFAVHDELGNEIDTGTMAGWYEPLAVVRWIRDQLQESGKRLEPGQILSLGNIGILRQLHEGSPRGPAYTSNEFILDYYGLSDEAVSVTIKVNRAP
jgi:2-keto-4-pentenoate hydratase